MCLDAGINDGHICQSSGHCGQNVDLKPAQRLLKAADFDTCLCSGKFENMGGSQVNSESSIFNVCRSFVFQVSECQLPAKISNNAD